MNLSKRNEKGELPLQEAVIKGHIEKVKEYLAMGAPVNIHDFEGWLVIIQCARDAIELTRSM